MKTNKMKEIIAKCALATYIIAAPLQMGAEYVNAGIRTGEWNPIRQEWKATEHLAEAMAMSRNLPIYEPREIFAGLENLMEEQ